MTTREGITLPDEVWALADGPHARAMRRPVITFVRGRFVVREAEGALLRVLERAEGNA